MNVVCKNIGSNERFKCSAQMYHHLNNCKYPESPILRKYKKVGNQFECNSCKKCFSHQPNVTRHVIICKGIKQKKVYKCTECKNIHSASIHEATVVSSVIDYLKELNKKSQYPLMHQTMHNVFKDKMNDTNFLQWLASKLNIRPCRLFNYVANWKDRNFTETRGKNEFLLK